MDCLTTCTTVPGASAGRHGSDGFGEAGKRPNVQGRLIESLILMTKSAAKGNTLHKQKKAIAATSDPEARWHLAHKTDYMLMFSELRGTRIARELRGADPGALSILVVCTMGRSNTDLMSGKTNLCNNNVIITCNGAIRK